MLGWLETSVKEEELPPAVQKPVSSRYLAMAEDAEMNLIISLPGVNRTALISYSLTCMICLMNRIMTGCNGSPERRRS